MSLVAHALTTEAAIQEVVGTGFTTSRVERLIAAITDAIEDYCGRSFGYAAITTAAPEYYQGTNQRHLTVRRAPIHTISRVRIDESDVTTDVTSVLTADLKEQGVLLRDSGFQMSTRVHGDLTRDPNTSRDQRGWNVDVCGTFGFVLPQYQQSGTVTSGTTAVSALTDTTNLAVGMYVTGTGIPANTTISAIGSTTTLTLSANATTSGARTLTFYAAGAAPPSTVTRLPYDLEQACIDEVVVKLVQPLPGLESERTDSGHSQRWRARGRFAAETYEVLNPYKRDWFR